MARTFLEPVAAGQSRFRLHGLGVDGRGVAVGRETLLIFETIDRLVGFLGAYSEEQSLDQLFLSMTLETGRREGGGRVFVLRCEGGDSYGLEGMARLAAATRAKVYTGSGSLFVAPRDRKTPFGFDLAVSVDTLGSVGPDDVVAVSETFVTRLSIVDRLDPLDLVQRLSMRQSPVPAAGISDDPALCGMAEMALVLVAPGLARRITHWLWRREVPMAGLRCSLREGEEGSLLLRLRNPPPEALDILHRIPGVELFAPVSPRAAVEVGWRHPIHLASANACLPGDEVYLFRGGAGRVERLPGAPRFVDGSHLVEHDIGTRPASDDEAAVVAHEVERLRLRPRRTAVAREPAAVLIPWSEAAGLRGLAYILPPSVLAACEAARTEHGLLIVADRGVGSSIGAASMLPLGRRLVEAAPGVLVPDGFELWPRVRPQLVRDLLSLGPDELAVYGEDEDLPPVKVRAQQRRPLDHTAVEAVAAQESGTDPLDEQADPHADAVLTNERVGRFALWRYKGEG